MSSRDNFYYDEYFLHLMRAGRPSVVIFLIVAQHRLGRLEARAARARLALVPGAGLARRACGVIVGLIGL